MKRGVTLLVLLSGYVIAQPCVSKPCSTSANFAYDLMGSPDTRPDTWGLAGAQTKAKVFSPPPGYVTRILRVQGNFIAWPRGTPLPDGSDNIIGHAMGVSIAFQDTTGSADGCFIYKQLGLKAEPGHLDFDLDTSIGGLLQPDNTMNVIAAVWLNSDALCAHIEITFIVLYQYELPQP